MTGRRTYVVACLAGHGIGPEITAAASRALAGLGREHGFAIEELLAACRRFPLPFRQRMTFEKSPKAVVFGKEIPVTTTGKYQRLKLQDLFKEWEQIQFRK